MQRSKVFSEERRIGRAAFAAGIAAATAVLWAGLTVSEWLLPAMARLLSPRGINAGLALNAVWLALGAAYLAVLAVLLVGRLRDAGRPPALALAVIVPMIGWAVLSDAVFLWRRHLPLPPFADPPLAAIGALIVLWGLLEGLLRPSIDGHRDH
jgi:uncharacterized membrane protein YhaH (DUF805 family)